MHKFTGGSPHVSRNGASHRHHRPLFSFRKTQNYLKNQTTEIYFFHQSKMKQWDDKYFKKVFLISECEPDMLRAYRRHAQYV
jgi:hypothetical protein